LSRVRIYKSQNLITGKTEKPFQELDPYSRELEDGVFVG